MPIVASVASGTWVTLAIADADPLSVLCVVERVRKSATIPATTRTTTPTAIQDQLADRRPRRAPGRPDPDATRGEPSPAARCCCRSRARCFWAVVRLFATFTSPRSAARRAPRPPSRPDSSSGLRAGGLCLGPERPSRAGEEPRRVAGHLRDVGESHQGGYGDERGRALARSLEPGERATHRPRRAGGRA